MPVFNDAFNCQGCIVSVVGNKVGIWSIGGMILTRKSEVFGAVPVPASLRLW